MECDCVVSGSESPTGLPNVWDAAMDAVARIPLYRKRRGLLMGLMLKRGRGVAQPTFEFAS
eukprot:4404524-Amphidinium_carterae.1